MYVSRFERIQHMNVTDTETDGRTDRRTDVQIAYHTVRLAQGRQEVSLMRSVNEIL